jgi:hypothetical protein
MTDKAFDKARNGARFQNIINRRNPLDTESEFDRGFGRGWDASAARYTELVRLAELKRNVILWEGKHPGFVGTWVAIPERDFDLLRAALQHLKEAEND